MESEVINYGILSLVPAVTAIVLAFKTKNVILSLLISLFVGTMIIANYNPWIALQNVFGNYLFVDMTGGSNAQTIVMMLIVGGFVALIEKSGGARAFAKAVSNSINSKAKAQISCWAGGLAIFFSDSGNSLMIGPIFRPIMDRLQISRAKLAYILDSTSAPVCILVPVTGWGVYIMSIIATEFEVLGIGESEATVFMKAIPFQFYAILALLLIPLIALGGRDFGFMAAAEKRAKLGLTPDQMDREEAIIVSDEREVSVWNMVLPLLILFAVILVMFVGWGFPSQNIPGSKIRIALTSGYFLASISLLLMIVKQGLMTFTEAFNVFVSGMQKMTSILVIIVIAWGVGSVCGDLGTSAFVVDSTLGVITPKLVPALLFLIGSVVSFATGTSWGTMAILLPLGIHMAFSFEVSQYITIAAVLSGSLFGDHCSPISDTTVMSSMASGCDLVDHVKTQLPYAGLVAVATFAAYLAVGFIGLGAAVGLVTAVVILLVFYAAACKLWGIKAEMGEEGGRHE